MDNEILLKLYGLYHKELYLYLYSLCGDRHLAEDLLHETFLKALLALLLRAAYAEGGSLFYESDAASGRYEDR